MHLYYTYQRGSMLSHNFMGLAHVSQREMRRWVYQVYRRDGRNPLFIYYFTSERDRLSLWVIGPQLGQFIAGVRNSNPGTCVHDLGSGWKYASR